MRVRSATAGVSDDVVGGNRHEPIDAQTGLLFAALRAAG
jgi:hypothetical protein